jgi:hypothetical protein
MNDIGLGFQVMGYGLLGVFFVLMLFYGVIVGLGKVFPVDKE